MNDYIQLRLDITPHSDDAADLLAALLADAGFESFVPDNVGLTAFAPSTLFNPQSVDNAIKAIPLDVKITQHPPLLVEGRDWNAEWEKNYFSPIVIAGKCVIHSSFHTDFPQCPYDITIDPKMAFGTGHHSTTSLIVDQLLKLDLQGQAFLDMGTGTGILAILAAMRGASPVYAVEIDPFAHANALENTRLNGHPEINLALGDASALADIHAIDVLVANINRNVIVADIQAYAATLAPAATILLSGFYIEDIPVIVNAANRAGLKFVSSTDHDRWACVRLENTPQK